MCSKISSISGVWSGFTRQALIISLSISYFEQNTLIKFSKKCFLSYAFVYQKFDGNFTPKTGYLYSTIKVGIKVASLMFFLFNLEKYLSFIIFAVLNVRFLVYLMSEVRDGEKK